MQSIFTNENVIHLLELFFWLLGAFLIGIYFGRLSKKEKKDKAHQHFKDDSNDHIDLIDDISKVRATKTFERGGKETVKSVIYETMNEGLNFNRIGKSSLQNKDNLQKIKGIGKTVEEKLNNIGIYSYKQITNFNAQDIQDITALTKLFSGKIERDDWIGQAHKLLNNNKL